MLSVEPFFSTSASKQEPVSDLNMSPEHRTRLIYRPPSHTYNFGFSSRRSHKASSIEGVMLRRRPTRAGGALTHKLAEIVANVDD